MKTSSLYAKQLFQRRPASMQEPGYSITEHSVCLLWFGVCQWDIYTYSYILEVNKFTNESSAHQHESRMVVYSTFKPVVIRILMRSNEGNVSRQGIQVKNLHCSSKDTCSYNIEENILTWIDIILLTLDNSSAEMEATKLIYNVPCSPAEPYPCTSTSK